jgi:hypothetical protein
VPVIKTNLVQVDHASRDWVGVREERVGLIVECSAGNNPLDEPGVPQIGGFVQTPSGALIVRGLTRATYHTTEAGKDRYTVEFAATNEPTKQWGMRFVDRSTAVPVFNRHKRWHRNSSGQLVSINDWRREEWLVEEAWIVLERSVVIDRLSPTGFIQLIEPQVNRLHTFFGRLWKLRSPQSQDLGVSKTIVNYTWEADPGTGPLVDDMINSDFIAPDFPRPPFSRYRIKPAADLGGFPTIEALPLFPPASPYRVPNGWQLLPGDPVND